MRRHVTNYYHYWMDDRWTHEHHWVRQLWMDDDVDSGDVNDGNWEDDDEEPQHRSSFVLLGRDHDGGLRNNVEAVGGCDSRTDRSEVCDAC